MSTWKRLFKKKCDCLKKHLKTESELNSMASKANESITCEKNLPVGLFESFCTKCGYHINALYYPLEKKVVQHVSKSTENNILKPIPGHDWDSKEFDLEKCANAYEHDAKL